MFFSGKNNYLDLLISAFFNFSFLEQTPSTPILVGAEVRNLAKDILDFKNKIKLNENLDYDEKIVLYLSFLNHSARTGEISKVLEIHQVRVNNVLTTLEKYHFVEKTTEKYPPAWYVTEEGRTWGGRNV